MIPDEAREGSTTNLTQRLGPSGRPETHPEEAERLIREAKLAATYRFAVREWERIGHDMYIRELEG